MIKGIQFYGKEWDRYNDDNCLVGLTNNTIILCNDLQIKSKIVNAMNDMFEHELDNSEDFEFEYDDEDDDISYEEKIFIDSDTITIFNLYNQKITISTEPSVVYKANFVNDIWFAIRTKNERYSCNFSKESPYLYSMYPMTIFRSSGKYFKKGLDRLYKDIINGCYGVCRL